VAVYGFPIGGVELSITEGVVSRIEHHRYTHSRAYLLTCQIDAAINPGNSGGPVLKEGKIVGVAFQAGRGENIGYMVPVPVIKRFLADIEDGKYDGIPGIGISWQQMENPDIRKKYGMSEDQSGILVLKTYPDSPAEKSLEQEDVILSIDNADIENDGKIEFRKREMTFFGYMIQKKLIGETLKLKVLRKGEIKNVSVELTKPMSSWDLVPNMQYDLPPTYYITGGLLFEPLTENLLKSWGGGWRGAPINLSNHFFYGEQVQDRRQVIILVKVLADEVNMGYHDWGPKVITGVNGRNISTMEELLNAFNSNTGKYHEITSERGEKLIIDREKAASANPGILKKYKINSDRSEDMKKYK
jgi:S1-C subfamily serine protease